MNLLFTERSPSQVVVTHTDAGFCRDLYVGDIYKYWDGVAVFEVDTSDSSLLRFSSKDLRDLADKLDQLNETTK